MKHQRNPYKKRNLQILRISNLENALRELRENITFNTHNIFKVSHKVSHKVSNKVVFKECKSSDFIIIKHAVTHVKVHPMITEADRLYFYSRSKPYISIQNPKILPKPTRNNPVFITYNMAAKDFLDYQSFIMLYDPVFFLALQPEVSRRNININFRSRITKSHPYNKNDIQVAPYSDTYTNLVIAPTLNTK